MEKIAQGCGQETNTVQGEAECCIGLETHALAIFFFILHECGSTLTGLKHFWSTNYSFWRFQKFYACDQQYCIFHTQYCYFQRVLHGKNSTVIRLMFTHGNALKHIIEHSTPQTNF